MDPLSGFNTHQLGILDLPNEVLLEIFKYFEIGAVTGPANVNWSEYIEFVREKEYSQSRLHDVRNLRLVCRTFNSFAAPLMCPVLHIQLEPESLRRAETLTRSPDIAAGIRGIRVGINYCTDPRAETIWDFAKLCEYDIAWLGDICAKHKNGMRRWDRAVFSGEQGANMAKEYRECFKAVRIADELSDSIYPPAEGAVDGCFEDNGSGGGDFEDEGFGVDEFGDDSSSDDDSSHEDPGELLPRLTRLVCTAYQIYKAKRNDHEQYLSNGTYMAAVATCVQRLSRHVPVSFGRGYFEPFTGAVKGPTNSAKVNWAIRTLCSEQNLIDLLSCPLRWRKEEKPIAFHPWDVIAPMTIVIMACHGAGYPIKSLDLSIFPKLRRADDDDEDEDPVPSYVDPSWRGLNYFKTTCQQLEKISFRDHGLVMLASTDYFEDSCFLPDTVTPLAHFVDSLFLSPALTELSMNGWDYAKDPELERLQDDRRLCRIDFTDGTFDQTDFEDFCRNIGPNLKHLKLNYVTIEQGYLSDAADILRKRIAQRKNRDSACKVELRGLTTLDICWKYTEGRDGWKRTSLQERNLMTGKLEDYIAGKLQRNPIREVMLAMPEDIRELPLCD